MANGFKDIRFPEDIAYGSSGGPAYSTTIVITKSGKEKRNINWSMPKSEYDVAYGIERQEQLEKLIAFFHIMQGRGYSFRFKDHMDYRSAPINQDITDTDQPLVTVNGTKYLAKHYSFGGESKIRIITKPVQGTVVLNDAESSVDHETGVVTGDATAAGFEFDIHARFDTDSLSTVIDDYQQGNISVSVIEIKDLMIDFGS